VPKNRIFRGEDIERIVNLIRAWPNEKITWVDVCKKSEPLLGFVPSRQGLNQHETVVDAFQAKKRRLRISPKEASPMPASLAVASKRIAMLNAEIDELKRTNARLIERFLTWQYNAHVKNMTEAELDRPLPCIDREVNKPKGGGK